MNLDHARIVLRPRTLAETFDLGLRWCSRVGGGLYLRLSAVVLLPAALLCWSLRVVFEYEWALVWLAAGAMAMVVQGPFTVAASRLMFEQEVTARSVLRQFVGRLGAYVVGLFVTRLILALASVLVVTIPFGWMMTAFVHEAVLLEGQGGLAASKRARTFLQGQGGTVFILGVGLAVAIGLFMTAADQVGMVLFDFTLQLGRPFGSLWDDGGSLTAMLGFFAAVPYVASVRFLQYIDSRTRRDGWDLQFAFLALTTAERAQGPARAEVGGAA